MSVDAIVTYFLIVVVTVGIGILTVLWITSMVSDLESKLTGIWANESNTLRILIYSMESKFKAEVVWTRNSEVNLLGSDVIRNLTLRFFRIGEGTYIDPFSKHQFNLKLKVKDNGCLHFHLIEKTGLRKEKVESWRQVK